MKTINFFFAILTGFSILNANPLIAGENRYNVSDIPESLLKNAKAVVRNKETVFEVYSANRAVQKVKYAITIVNMNGIKESLFKEFYDSFSRIKKIDGYIYNGQGELVKKINSSAIQDYSAISGFSLYEDTRVKFIDPRYRTVPFTVEYFFEIEYSGLLNYPYYRLYEDYNISVQKSAFKVIVPHKSMIRYYEKNTDAILKIKDYQERVGYSWEFSDKEALQEEFFSPPLVSYTPVIYTGSADFEMDGIRGNSESWQNVGLWSYRLNQGRNMLDKETEDRIRSMIMNTTSDNDRIRILYEYLQNKTRYVSTQIGIGGWQAIDARTVDRLSYGDCKALSNYMQAMLNVIGVKSYWALAMAGRDAPDIVSAFPSPRFNHVILCVPGTNDTIWLECTSQYEPFGAIGTFTDDRDVLIVTENGGVLARTKAYTQDDSRQIRNAVVSMDSTGSGEAFIKTSYSGKFYDDLSGILRMDEKDKKKKMLSHIDIPSFELVGFKYVENRNKTPSIDEEINLKINNYGTLLGDRILLGLNLMTKIGVLSDQETERKSNIFIRRAYTTIDTITYKIPKGYIYTIKPELKPISSKFGEYSAKLIAAETEIKYIRMFKINKGNYPASSYSDFIDFYNKISQADEYKIALKKK